MASIHQRKNKDGIKKGWRAVIRTKGHPTVCEHFDRKQEAEDWANDVERQIKMGQFKYDQFKGQHTFSDLVDRYTDSGALEHLKAADDTIRHLSYWKERFKAYALVHLTPEFISKERRLLLDTPTTRRGVRSPSTVNRYMSSLSAVLTYACQVLLWTNDNPCLKLKKLKEPLGRDRVLSEEEAICLLKTCRESKSPYLYCIVLIALTTGMRKGEILGLTWQQLDFENQIAHLKETKNGRPRSIPLIPAVIEELEKLYEKRNPAKSHVFASRTVFGKLDIKKSWGAVIKRSGISGVVFHSLRHTFTTYAARQGASTLELSCATGHRSLSSLQNYTHLEAEMTRKFGERIYERILEENKHD